MPDTNSALPIDKRLLRQAWLVRASLFLAIASGLCGAIATVGQAWLISWVIHGVFLRQLDLSASQPALGAILLLAVVRAFLTWVRTLAGAQAAVHVKHSLRDSLMNHLLFLGPSYTQKHQSGELANTAMERIEAIDTYFHSYLPQLALAALIPTTILLFVFPLDWPSALILLLTAPLLPLFLYLVGSVSSSLAQQQWTTQSRLSAQFMDSLRGLVTLKLLGQSHKRSQAIAQASDQFRQSTMTVLRVAFLSALVLEMVATISTAIVAVQIGLRLLNGRLEFADALFVLLLAPEFYLPLRTLGAHFHAGMQGVAAAQRVFEILETPRQPQLKEQSSQLPDCAEPQALRFDDVYYAYQGGERPALHGMSFGLAPGKTVALVGPSGAGKSTVAHLLLGFLQPQKGRILVGDRDLITLDTVWWRTQIAWVPQNPYLFQGTVAENLQLANPQASEPAIRQACRQAHADQFIAALPKGYNTQIGERGTRLSGGQAQRIALARAFLKDAPYLILDEASAHLDPETDDMIQDALVQLLPGRTAILIAHRLHTVQHAHQILVAADGHIVQAGTHRTLMMQPGLYRRLAGDYFS